MAITNGKIILFGILLQSIMNTLELRVGARESCKLAAISKHFILPGNPQPNRSRCDQSASAPEFIKQINFLMSFLLCVRFHTLFWDDFEVVVAHEIPNRALNNPNRDGGTSHLQIRANPSPNTWNTPSGFISEERRGIVLPTRASGINKSFTLGTQRSCSWTGTLPRMR